MSSETTIPCPVCQAAVPVAPRPTAFPFCSVKCKAIDLGRWFDGNYALDPESGKLDVIDPEKAVELPTGDEDGYGYH